jgi:hypothetical protein
MRSLYEPQIFAAVIKYSNIEGEFLREISNNYVMTTTSLIPDFSWENLRIPERLIQGMRIRGFPNLRQETYDNWISINNESFLLTPLIKNPQVTLISEEE